MKFESFSSYGNIGDYGWVSFFDFFTQIGVINHKEFNEFKNTILSGVYDMIQLNGFCIVNELPSIIKRNDNNRLHCINGPAIKWKDGYEVYFVNGRAVPDEKYIQALQGKISKEDWLKESNEDIKAAWFEILGSEKVMGILGAEQVDSSMTIHANGEIEEHILYKTPFILPEVGEKLAWVKYVCPSTNSNYLISCNPKWDKVSDAVIDQSPFFGEEIKSIEDYSFNARG